jgi:hypothetical protein
MSEARHALEVTRRMHALAASPEGQTLTLTELERAAEQELAAEVGQARVSPSSPAVRRRHQEA